MRFEKLTLKNYGIFPERRLDLSGDPGLTIVHGPNEAGKSTCLAAISDFLFGIPHNSPYGSVFGYPQMRLEAVLQSADGKRLELRRRKGKAKTLTTGDGAALDEAVLASLLGPTTRDRFEALFGLGHRSLREGGERLLRADGDIGRLIIEAGGGLDRLVEAMDQLKEDASRLFTPRRSSEKAFYRALDALKDAEKHLKEALLTRDAFEQQGQQALQAEQRHAESRSRLLEHNERISREERIITAAPALIRLAGCEEQLRSFEDLPELREDFAQQVRKALEERDRWRTSLRELESARSELESQINDLVVPKEILSAESLIRDVAEKALHVRNERESRPKRQEELAQQEARLGALRAMAGIAADAEIAALVPSIEALDSADGLIAAQLELKPRIEDLENEVETLEDQLKALEERRVRRSQAGFDRPSGIDSSQFSDLPRLSADLESRRSALERTRGRIELQLASLEVSSLEVLRDLRCPDADVIQAEAGRRDELTRDLARQAESEAAQTAQMESAQAEIDRLREAGDIATDAAIRQARQDREQAWIPIRQRFLSGDPSDLTPSTLSKRSEAAARLEARTGQADELADRRTLEAQRIADMTAAGKKKADAAAALKGVVKAKQELAQELSRLQKAFAEAWPQALENHSNLGRLKTFSQEREAILKLAEELEGRQTEFDRLQAEHSTRWEALVLAERTLNSEPDSKRSPIERIEAVKQRARRREEEYSEHLKDSAKSEQIRGQLNRKRSRMGELHRNLSEGLDRWPALAAEIRLSGDTAFEKAREVVRLWRSARGELDGIALTRKRLDQFDQDERKLREMVVEVGSSLRLQLSEDAVAAAGILRDRLDQAMGLRNKRDALEPELRQRTRERDAKRKQLESCQSALASLCDQAGVEESSLAQIAQRQEEFLKAQQERVRIQENLRELGAGLSIEELRQRWDDRDPDSMRSHLAQLIEDRSLLEAEKEEAYAAWRESLRLLSGFESDAGYNALVAERQRSIAEMHQVVERYMQVTLAQALLEEAVGRLRQQQRDPLLVRAGEMFRRATRDALVGIESDVDDKGNPVVVGLRPSGEEVPIAQMSDGVRDQLFLSFRLASIERYCQAAEPLPFIADDLLVHFDDERSAAGLELLAELGKTTQVLLFTHHRSVVDASAELVRRGEALVKELK